MAPRPPLRDPDLRLHLLGDAELLQRCVEAHAGAGTRRRVGIGRWPWRRAARFDRLGGRDVRAWACRRAP